MKQFSLRLNKANQRPIAILREWHKFSAMVDTGALYPVWVEDTKILDNLKAERISDRINITIPDEESTVRNVRIYREDGMLRILCSSVG